jgi:hypothetical protein
LWKGDKKLKREIRGRQIGEGRRKIEERFWYVWKDIFHFCCLKICKDWKNMKCEMKNKK